VCFIYIVYICTTIECTFFAYESVLFGYKKRTGVVLDINPALRGL
jgi:hypothetical protein